MADVIAAEGLEKVFPGKKGQAAVRALAGVTLAARAGEMTALIGPDGAGKTTFMRLVCGLMEPTAGRLTVCGLDVTRTPQAVQAAELPAREGYVPSPQAQAGGR